MSDATNGYATVHERDSRDGRVSRDLGAWEDGLAGGFSAEGVALLVPGKVLGGRYRLFERIARGGMGSVWSAVDEQLQREVAIKLMAPEIADDEEYRGRFVLEARVVASLSSAHVVTVFDAGECDGMPYMVLERLEGEDLHTRLKRAGRLSLSACEHILTHVARGLSAAHAAGIIHRDIKPSNIFIAHTADLDGDGEETVKVLDFGVAKHGGKTSGFDVLLGSPHFMSPEQILGRGDVDYRTDLFSLAAVMYRCVLGRLPFDGDLGELTLRICHGGYAPPTRVLTHLPRELDSFFARALSGDARGRFRSATAMAQAFRRIVEVETSRRIAQAPPRRELTLRLATTPPPPPLPSRPPPPSAPSAPPFEDPGAG